MSRRTRTTPIRRGLAAALAALLVQGCAGPEPLPVVDNVDLERFMGRWYVLANIPTFMERDAYNAVEAYRREADGTIATTFTFRRGGFDGKPIEYTPRGFVSAESAAIWGMQFVWPIKAEYRIVYLEADYSLTAVGRSARDYAWLMGRTPELAEADYERFVALLRDLGYDTAKIQKVPQRW
jgi:apolipoprotein D and lipocalin family protein